MKIFNILILISIIPLVGVMLLILIPGRYNSYCFNAALFISSLTFILSLIMWLIFDFGHNSFQFLCTIDWLPAFNFYYTVGVDGISLFFLILTTFLIMVCVLISWGSINYRLKEYLINFLLLEFLLIQVFSVLDLLLFYVFFESILMPMFLIIGIWGSRERKIWAAYQFFCIH